MNERLEKLGLEDGETKAVALAAGGTLAFLVGMIRHSWVLRILGLLAALTGGGLIARGRFAKRAEKIDAAESTIRSELDDLDPVARAQVLADIAREQI